MSKHMRAGGTPPGKVSRRGVLRGGLSAGTAILIPLVNTSCTSAQGPAAGTAEALDANTNAMLAAFVNRIVPADETGPAASECGVVRYINRSLAEWNQADIPLLTTGLQALDQVARSRYSQEFVALTGTQQDELLTAMEAGTLTDIANAQQLFNRLHRLTLEGMFSDPYYGGNANYAGWDLIGYPGAVLASTQDMQKMGERLPALHTSAYGAEHDGH
jgi:gluconate 2-dehydrogenase gamma chain